MGKRSSFLFCRTIWSDVVNISQLRPSLLVVGSDMGFSLVQLLDDLFEGNAMAAGLCGKAGAEFVHLGAGFAGRPFRRRGRGRGEAAASMLRREEAQVLR